MKSIFPVAVYFMIACSSMVHHLRMPYKHWHEWFHYSIYHLYHILTVKLYPLLWLPGEKDCLSMLPNCELQENLPPGIAVNSYGSVSWAQLATTNCNVLQCSSFCTSVQCCISSVAGLRSFLGAYTAYTALIRTLPSGNLNWPRTNAFTATSHDLLVGSEPS